MPSATGETHALQIQCEPPPRWRLTIWWPGRIDRTDPPHLLVDRTGLKTHGEGEWLDLQHGISSPRRGRKMPLKVDTDTHEIVAAEPTPGDMGGIAELPDLPDRIDAGVAS